MIGKQDLYQEKREKSRHICQQCDLVEELSDEDLENVAGGALSDFAQCGAVFTQVAYGVRPLYGVAVARYDHLMAPMNLRIRG